MSVLELCAGYGGLGLGIKIAVPSARVVGIVERQAYCVARWQERMHALGNGVVPLQAALAFTLLARRAGLI